MALGPGTHYKHECHSKALFAVFILFPLTQIKFCAMYANITKRTVLENSWFTYAWMCIYLFDKKEVKCRKIYLFLYIVINAGRSAIHVSVIIVDSLWSFECNELENKL